MSLSKVQPTLTTLRILAAIYLLSIYLTLPFTPDIILLLATKIGWKNLSWLLNGLLIMASGIVLILLYQSLKLCTWIWAGLPVLGLGVLASTMEKAVERIHFLQYALFGLLLFLAMGKPTGKKRLWVLVGVFLAGLLDETIQWVLPNRYWDIKDVATDFLGGALGVWLTVYLFSEKNTTSLSEKSS